MVFYSIYFIYLRLTTKIHNLWNKMNMIYKSWKRTTNLNHCFVYFLSLSLSHTLTLELFWPLIFVTLSTKHPQILNSLFLSSKNTHVPFISLILTQTISQSLTMFPLSFTFHTLTFAQWSNGLQHSMHLSKEFFLQNVYFYFHCRVSSVYHQRKQ